MKSIYNVKPLYLNDEMYDRFTKICKKLHHKPQDFIGALTVQLEEQYSYLTANRFWEDGEDYENSN